MILHGIEDLPDTEVFAVTTAEYVMAHFDGMVADAPVFGVTVIIERVEQVSSSKATSSTREGFMVTGGGRRWLGQPRTGGHREQHYRYGWQGERRQNDEKWVEVTYDQTSTYKISLSHANDRYDGVYVATAPFTGCEALSAYVERLRALSPVYYAALTSVSSVAVRGVAAQEDTLTTYNVEDGDGIVNVGTGSRKGDGNVDNDKAEHSGSRTYIIVGAVCAGLVLATTLATAGLLRWKKKRGAEGDPVGNGPRSSMPHRVGCDGCILDDDSIAFHPASVLLENDDMHSHTPVLGHSLGSSSSSSITTIVHIIAPAGKLGVVVDTPPGGGPAYVCEVKPTSSLLGKIQISDKIVAVDDEDVQRKTAVEVSKLLGSKSANENRNITVLRETKPCTAYGRMDLEALVGETEARGRFPHDEKCKEEEQAAVAANTRLSSGATPSAVVLPKQQQDQQPTLLPKQRFDIVAPPGKLGISLATPDSPAPLGPAFVVDIRGSHIILTGGLRLGDEIIAIDDRDVRTMSAIDVSKLLGSKSKEKERKITILRDSCVEATARNYNESNVSEEKASSSPQSGIITSTADPTLYRRTSMASSAAAINGSTHTSLTKSPATAIASLPSDASSSPYQWGTEPYSPHLHLVKSQSGPVVSSSSQGGSPHLSRSKSGWNKEEIPRGSVSRYQSMLVASKSCDKVGGLPARKEAPSMKNITNSDTTSMPSFLVSSPALSPAHAATGSSMAFDIVLPAGKTGLVIGSSSEGNGLASYISGVAQDCPVRDKVLVGDVIMAVDGEDVSKLKGVHVSMLLRSKSKNEMRKITVKRSKCKNAMRKNTKTTDSL